MSQHRKMKSENNWKEWLSDGVYGLVIALVIFAVGSGSLALIFLVGVAFGWW